MGVNSVQERGLSKEFIGGKLEYNIVEGWRDKVR